MAASSIPVSFGLPSSSVKPKAAAFSRSWEVRFNDSISIASPSLVARLSVERKPLDLADAVQGAATYRLHGLVYDHAKEKDMHREVAPDTKADPMS